MGSEQRFLLELSGLLGLRLKLPEALRRAAQLFVADLADGCWILLEDVECSIAVVEHRDPVLRRKMASLEGRPIGLSPDESLWTALDANRPLASTTPHRKPLLKTKSATLDALVAEHNHLIIPLPFRADDERAGAVVLLFAASRHPGIPFDPTLIANLVDALVTRARLFEEARQVIRVRSEFMAVVSHELKNAFTAIRLSFELLEKQLQVVGVLEHEPALSATLVRGDRQLDRLDRLLGDLLDVTQISRGTLLLRTETVDLGAVVSDVVQRFEKQGSGREPLIHVQVSSGLRGEWDRVRIEQIVSNLLSNALKYGSGRPVEVAVRDLGKVSEISVLDHGIGIAPEDMPRLFKLFERVGDVRRAHGTGIGLFIARELVRLHGGSIEVFSTVGQGTQFVVRLPRFPVLDPEEALALHTRWKQRIRSYIDGSSLEMITPDQVRGDDRCTLGNWIHRMLSRTPDNPALMALRDVHRRFHEEAARVLETFETKGAGAAQELLSPGGEYVRVTEEIVQLLGGVKSDGL